MAILTLYHNKATSLANSTVSYSSSWRHRGTNAASTVSISQDTVQTGIYTEVTYGPPEAGVGGSDYGSWSPSLPTSISQTGVTVQFNAYSQKYTDKQLEFFVDPTVARSLINTISNIKFSAKISSSSNYFDSLYIANPTEKYNSETELILSKDDLVINYDTGMIAIPLSYSVYKNGFSAYNSSATVSTTNVSSDLSVAPTKGVVLNTSTEDLGTVTFQGQTYEHVVKITKTYSATRTMRTSGSGQVLTSEVSSELQYGSLVLENIVLELQYSDIIINATPNSSTQSSDTSITFSISSADSTKTLKDCYFTASFTHERSGISKVFHSEPEFKVSNLNQIYPYIQGSENYNGAIQNLFLYIPDIWERNTANEIIFAEGDIYTVTLTATKYTIDDTVITNPVTANFVYTIGSVTKLTLNSINSTLTNTSSVANDALLEFSLYGTLGTYAVETISWTGELQKADGTKVCTLEYAGYEKTSIETGTNVKLGTGKYRIPSDYRSQVLSGGPYKIYITATATTYDNTTVGPINNTFENWVFVPSEYTLSLKSGLNEGQEVYAGQEITSSFALSKTGANQAETGVQYTFKIKINNTNYLEITTYDTAYTWYCDDILGPVTYEISCEANIGGQGPKTETVNCTTYARLMQSSAIVTDKNEYYNTESAIITSKITIPAPALTKEVILSVKNKEELTRYTIPVQDSSYTASQLKFTLNLARELYLKYRGPIQITLAAIARDGVNSAYVKTEYSTVSKTIYIINSAGKFIYPVEGATTVIPHPDFMIQSEKGTFATGYGFVSLGDGKWIRVALEADAKDNTKYRFKQPYVIANNTDYTLQFKETLELDKYSEVLSSQIAVSWKTNFVDLNFVTEGNYRLLEKYNYRKYLINLLNWYGALSDDLNNIEKTTNKSQLSKLIDVVTTLFGDKQVYSTIASALEKYGNDSPQTWNAFIAAQLYNARQYKN